MPSPSEFPRLLLNEQAHSWNIAGAMVVPGQGDESSPGVRTDAGGRWKATLEEIVFLGADWVRLWRAVRTIANGGATPLLVPRLETSFAPFPVVDGVRVEPYEAQPWSDGTFNSDGSGFYTEVIACTTVGTALRRATSLRILFEADRASPLQGGEVFSLDHPIQGRRMHEIGTVEDVNDDGLTWDITFLPPLREATTAAMAIDFDRPSCTMRLLNPSSMDLRVEPFPFGRPGVTFIEHFYPLP